MEPLSATSLAGDRGPAEELVSAALWLARRFAAGATMWCVAAEWPAHGRHVAVEFVHPVIVGKRALPAVYVGGDGVAGALRLLARPGDVLVAVSTAEDTRTVQLLQRAEAWGLMRLWLGVGARPTSGYAERMIWSVDVDPGIAARSGDLVLLYHLLWELTHVVFEHPGLLEPEPMPTDQVCVTCADEGRVAEVRTGLDGNRAEVVVAGRSETVDISLVDPVGPGDLVLVHGGVALTTLEPVVPAAFEDSRS